MSATKVGLAAARPTDPQPRGFRYLASDTNQEWVSDGTEWIETTGGGGAAVADSVAAAIDKVFPLTNAINVVDGAFTDITPAGGLAATITNPSDENSMLVVATASLPNINLSSRDAGNAPTSKGVSAQRIAVLSHVETGQDATEGESVQYGDGLGSFIMPPLPITLTRTIGPGVTATFSVTDWLVTVDYDTGASDHVRAGTQEQGYQSRSRLVLQGNVLAP